MARLLQRTLPHLVAASLALAAPAQAQEEDIGLDEEFALLEEETITSASRHEQKVGFSPAQVVVIDRREILESGATTVGDLLRRFPVVDIYEFDPLYPSAEVRNSYRVMLLVDGREFNLEMFVAPFYALLPVGLEDIERIEIVLGPNSAIYGANAVSAVVNIITRDAAEKLSAVARLSGGEHGSTQLEGQLRGRLGPLHFRVSGSLDWADSWMVSGRRSREVYRFSARSGLEFPGGRLTVDGGLSVASGRLFGIVGYVGTEEMIFAHADTSLELEHLKLRAWWYGVRGPLDLELGLTLPELGELGRIPTFHLTGDSVHFEAQYQLEPWSDNLLLLGADGRYTHYSSPQLVVPTEPGAHAVGEWRAGAYFHDEQMLGERWLLHAGLRFDWNSRTDWALSPRAAVLFNFSPGHYLRLSGGSAFRKPSIMETSMSYTVEAEPAFPEIKTIFEQQGIGNPELGNELLSTVELGYQGEFFARTLRLAANLFAGFNRHIIGFRTDVVLDSSNRIDLERTEIGYEDTDEDYDIIGLYLEAGFRPSERLELFVRGDIRLAWWTERDNTWMRLYPRYLVAAGGSWRSGWGLRLNLAAILVDAMLDVLRDPETALAPSQELYVPERLVVQAYLAYRFEIASGQLELGLAAFNPFNLRFREKVGLIDSQGENYGGELLGRRIQFVLRLEM